VAEISEQDAVVLRERVPDQDVGGFDVTMDQCAGVGGVEGAGYPVGDHAHAAVRHPRRKALAQ
jgi:hypothetical protein